jgi:hypothetical protein
VALFLNENNAFALESTNGLKLIAGNHRPGDLLVTGVDPASEFLEDYKQGA